MTRPSRHEMFMMMAQVAGTRSTCTRRVKVGTIITNGEGTTVVSMGYNGPPRSINEPCTDTPEVGGSCGCVHAEANALVKAPYGEALVLYTTLAPCIACARLIANSSVAIVYYMTPYRDTSGLELLARVGIIASHLPMMLVCVSNPWVSRNSDT